MKPWRCWSLRPRELLGPQSPWVRGPGGAGAAGTGVPGDQEPWVRAPWGGAAWGAVSPFCCQSAVKIIA